MIFSKKQKKPVQSNESTIVSNAVIDNYFRNNYTDTVGLYAIKDNTTEEFGGIFISKNDKIALKQFELEMCKLKKMADETKEKFGYYSFNSSDFSLYYLGNFSIQHGFIQSSVKNITDSLEEGREDE